MLFFPIRCCQPHICSYMQHVYWRIGIYQLVHSAPSVFPTEKQVSDVAVMLKTKFEMHSQKIS